MIRAVLAVVLASALLSVSLPVIDAIAQDRSAARMDRTVDQITGAATDLLREDPGPTARLAPRRLVTVSLTPRSLTTARVERITIDGDTETDGTARISYRVAGRGATSHRVMAPITTPDGPVTLRAAGDQTLVMRLVRDDESTLVLLSRRSPRAPNSEPGSPFASIRSGTRVQIPERDQVVS